MSLSSSSQLPEAERNQPVGRWVLSRRMVGLAVALLVGPLLLALVKFSPALDLRFQSGVGHFWIVSISAAISILLAFLMLWAAVVRRDGRLFLIGSAFLGLSTVFLIHAVSTPNVIFTGTLHATQWSTPLALLVGAIFFALSALDSVATRPVLMAHWRLWLAAGAVLWLIYGGIMLFYIPAEMLHATVATAQPTSQPQTALHDEHEEGEAYGGYGGYGERYAESGAPGAGGVAASPAPTAAPQAPTGAPSAQETIQSRLLALLPTSYPFLTATTMLLYLFAALSYGRRWRATPTRPLAAIACAAVLLAETSLSAQFGITWQVSFWLYHVLLIAAVGIATYGVVIGYEQSGSLSAAVEGLLLGSTLQRQREAFQNAMSALLGTLERGDVQATPGLRRELRQRFNLADDQLDLLDQSVQVVAREREEQRRLRALAEVSRAATLDLDPDILLGNAVSAFAKMADVSLCAVGLVAGQQIAFQPQHRSVGGLLAEEPLTLAFEDLPDGWQRDDEQAYITRLAGPAAVLAPTHDKVLLVPLSHHSQTLGILVVQPAAPKQIDDRLVDVCRSIASHLATSLSNARLYQALQREHDSLQRSEQAREQLTQMVVHDLKNPLTAIMGYLDLMRMVGPPPEYTEMIAMARRSSEGMLQLITDLLDIARLEEGRLELRREVVQLEELLQSCAAELRPWVEQAGKTLDVDGSVLPLLNIDAGLIRRVVTNLVSNAIKHTEAGTHIKMLAAQAEEGIELQICDDGSGIAPEVMGRLFQRFSAGQRAGHGQINTGLGLTFCKLAVEAHGGTISVSSAPGAGTTFTILLPNTIIAEPVES